MTIRDFLLIVTAVLVLPFQTAYSKQLNGDHEDPAVIGQVDLISFQAMPEQGYVRLEWAGVPSGSDIRVERSLDGIAFHPVRMAYSTKKELLSCVNVAFDTDAPEGIVYYRLVEVHGDGSVSYSSTVPTRGSWNRSLLLLDATGSSNTLEVKLQSGHPATGILRIFDDRGRLVFYREEHTSRGFNNYRIDMKPLRRGSYFVTLENGTELLTADLRK